MLTQGQRSFYDENGYLLLEGQLTGAEAGEFRQEAHALIERLSQHGEINPTWAAPGKWQRGRNCSIVTTCSFTRPSLHACWWMSA